MHVGTHQLTEEQARRLRARHPYHADQAWVAQTVAREGWVAVNQRYLANERSRFEAAMRDLLSELGLAAARSTEEALDLLELAFQVFAPAEEGFTGRLIREGTNGLRIEQPTCPTFRLFEEQRWHGVTACASWHRRRGWLDALGVRASDTVLAEQKWGDPACIAAVQVTGPRR